MDMNNMNGMMGIMAAWSVFQKNHPKFTAFLQAARTRGIREGSIIEISIQTPEGEKIETNMRIQPSDMEIIQMLASMAKKQ